MMKKVLCVLAVVLIIAGCSVPTMGRTEEEILADVSSNFVYVSDGDDDQWQTFDEINASWAGDCEDAVTLYLGLVYHETGEKLAMEAYSNGDDDHAVVRTPLVDYPLTPFAPGWVLSEDWEYQFTIGYDLWMLGTYVK